NSPACPWRTSTDSGNYRNGFPRLSVRRCIRRGSAKEMPQSTVPEHEESPYLAESLDSRVSSSHSTTASSDRCRGSHEGPPLLQRAGPGVGPHANPVDGPALCKDRH